MVWTDDWMYKLYGKDLAYGNADRTMIGVATRATTGQANPKIWGYGYPSPQLGSGLTGSTTNAFFDGFSGTYNAAVPTTWSSTTPSLLLATVGDTAGTNIRMRVNGGTPVANANTLITSMDPWNQLLVGGMNDGGNEWTGRIGEIINFPYALSTTQREAVESYLAIKYGMTIAHDYYASNGSTKIWDIGATAGYDADIAGIAREDCQALYQKQSRSSNGDDPVTMGAENTVAASNMDNTGTLSNGSFMLWGNNNGAMSWQSTEIPNAERRRLTREWRVYETGTVGSIKLSVPASNNSYSGKLPNEAVSVYLLVDADGDFSAGATEIEMTKNSVTKTWETNYDFSNGQYFTFATLGITAPGCVSNNLALWLKADQGLDVTSTWNDQSANGVNFTATTQPGGTNDLVAADAGINYNPSITFSPASKFFKNTSAAASNLMANSHTTIAIFKTTSPNSNDVAHQSPILMGNQDTGAYGEADFGLGGNGSMGLRVGVASDLYAPNLRGTSAVNNGLPRMATATRVKAAAGAAQMFINGLLETSNTNATNASLTGSVAPLGMGIGNSGGGNYTIAAEQWNGDIAEVVNYNTVLSATDREKVESYLALKYGITLQHNYVSGTGTVIWDKTAYATYSNAIAGLGRENCQGLHQKQSKSQANTLEFLTIGNTDIADNNDANLNSMTNNTFMLWGHNNASTAFTASISGTAADHRMARVWRIKETGTVGTTKLCIAANALNMASARYLLVHHTDAAFGAGVIEVPLVTMNNGCRVADYDFQDGDYFTFGNALEVAGDNIDNDGDGMTDNVDPDVCSPNGTGLAFVSVQNASPMTDNSFRLTSATASQAGASWYKTQADLTKPFRFEFDLYLGNNDGGADGLAFVMHNDPVTGSLAYGGAGGGLGYLGMKRSMAIEFDTYNNGAGYGDLANDHTSIRANGDMTTQYQVENGGAAVDLGNIEDGKYHRTVIEWDPVLKKLSMSMDGVDRVSYFGDVVSNFFYRNPNVYFGFTGSTGGAVNDQHFHIVKMDISIVEICGNGMDDDCDGLVDEDCCGTEFEKWNFARNSAPNGPEENVLTPNLGSQTGAIWYNSKANLNNAFDFVYNLYLGASDAGADGMAFVMHNDGRGQKAFGTTGGSIGYAGTNKIKPSLAIEFDTYNNGAGAGDIADDHAAFVVNGDLANPIVPATCLNSNCDNYEDDAQHPVRIKWDPSTQTLELFVDENLVSSYTGDIVNTVFGGNPNVYFGFTGSTGGATNKQSFTPVEVNITPSEICNNGIDDDCDGLIDSQDPDCEFYAPGGVTNGEQLWLKANDGVTETGGNTLTKWLDKSGAYNTPEFISSNPDLLDGTVSQAELVNFNPVVDFDGDDWLRWDNNNFNNTFEKGEVFIISKETVPLAAANGHMFDFGGASASHYTYSNGYIYEDFGATDRKVWKPSALVAGGLYEGLTSYGGFNPASPDRNTLNYNIYNNLSEANHWEGAFNGVTQVKDTTNTVDFTGLAHLGARSGAAFTGRIAEVVLYSTVLSPAERQRVNSYLGIKYGVTLGHDYYASDWNGVTGTKFWDIGGTGGFDNDIAGIGFDSISNLNQKQSQSINSDDIVTIGLGEIAKTNILNTSSFTGNKQFMLWGNNDGATTFLSNIAAPSGIMANRRMARTWKIDETGTIGTVKFAVPRNVGNGGPVYLVRSSDTSFNAADTWTQLNPYNVGTINYLAADVDFTDGQYFTIATMLVAPGCVVTPSAPVNGVNYTLYSGYDAVLSDGITGTVKHSGIINTLTNPDDVMLNEIGDNFSLKLTTNLSVTTAGTYQFQLNAVDDQAYLILDGTPIITNTGGGTFASAPIALTAGMHAIEVRFSEAGGAETLQLQWKGTTAGLDVGTTYAFVPDNKLFITPAISAWYKADVGVTATEGGNTTVWEDESDNNNKLTLYTANPLYYGTTLNQMVNGNPSVLFTDDQMEGPDDANGLGIGRQGKTVFSVVTKTALSGFAGWITAIGQDNCSGCSFGTYTTGADAYLAGWTNNTIATGYLTQTNMPLMLSGVYQNSNITATNNSFLYGNGAQIANATQTWNTTLNDNEDISVGTNQDYTGDGHDGKIMEVIHYPWALSTTERQKVETYLAIKYGLTQSHDYLAGDGTTIFSANGAGGANEFDSNIGGIGRDDCQGLNQKQSSSVNTGFQPTIALTSLDTTNIANINVFPSDKSFMIWGSNAGATTFGTSITAPASISANNRMNRIWQVQENANPVGSVKFAFPKGIIGNGGIVYLVTSNDTTFDATDNWKALTSLTVGSSKYLVTDVDFADGEYFSLATNVTAPGCVAGNLKAWMKADMLDGTAQGATVANWPDASLNSYTTTATSDPSYESTVLINYNPSVYYDGNDATMFPAATAVTANYSLFGMAKLEGSQNGRVFGSQTGNVLLGYHAGNEDQLYLNGWLNNPATTATTNLNMYSLQLSATGGNYEFRGEGSVIKTGTGAPATTWQTTLGGYATGAEPSKVYIPEFIQYNVDLDTLSVNKIESYLAIKYGQTLSHNYLAGDGTVLMTANGPGGANEYDSNIGVIGREDCQGLNQKQSGSVNAGLQVVMGLQSIDTSNVDNPNVFAADKSFMAWGNDAGTTGFGTALAGPSGKTNYRMNRVWQVQENMAPVGEVKFAVTNNLSITTDTTYLVVSSDNVFDNADTFIPLNSETINGISYLTTFNDFADGSYFTFAANIIAPGCVAGNLKVWMKADKGAADSNGAAVSTWINQATPYNLSQNTVANKPKLYTTTSSKLVNFNPSVYFDGSSQFLGNTTPLMPANSPYTFMAVGTDEDPVAGSYRSIFSSESTVDYFSLYKQGGAANDNGWVPYAIGGQSFSAPFLGDRGSMGKGTKYSIAGGANGYWNGTNFTSNSLTQVVQPQIVGMMSQNASTTSPFFAWTDGYKENPNWSPIRDGLAYQVPLFQATAIGADMNSAGSAFEFWKGRVPEFIVYDRVLTDTEMHRVNTYLALKYGMTLGQGNGYIGVNGNNYNYNAGDGSVIWDATANATYKGNIAGIGRDDCQALTQKQSMSVNAGFQPTIGLTITGSNQDNPITFPSDKSFMLWGSDAGSTSFGTSIVPPTGAEANNRMARIWKVQETGTVGTVTVGVPTTTGNGGKVYLVVSNDATIDASDTWKEMTGFTSGAGSYLAADVDLNNNQYFTFATYILAPGCVAGNLNMWLKADAGLTAANGGAVASWANQADNGLPTVDQATVASQPTFYSTTPGNLVNYNPALSFDGGDELKNLNRLYSNTSAFSVMGIGVDRKTANAFRAIMGIGADGNYPALDHQTDGTSPNGWNPWMTGSTPAEWSGGSAVLSTPGATNTIGNIVGLTSNNVASGTNNIISYVNGLKETTTLDAFQTNGTNQIGNGIFVGSSSDAQWIGLIPELIVYDRQVDSTEMQRIYSYLAIKYGTTLAQNYVSAAGVTLWTRGGGFDNDIAGIGYEKCEGLYQRQSKSVNTNSLIAIGLNNQLETTNAANTGTLNDKEFLLWGSNGGGTNFSGTGGTTTYPRLMNRKWKAAEWAGAANTDVISTLKVGITKSESSSIIREDEAYALLIDNDGDGDFSNATAVTGITIAGVLTFKNVNINHNAQFTLAEKAIAAPQVTCASNELRGSQRWWFTGNGAGLDFGVTGNSVSTYTNNPLNSAEGSSVVTTSTGQLLFSTDGTEIRDARHLVMPNGSGINGTNSSEQIAVSFQLPGNKYKYCVVANRNAAGVSFANGLSYSIVDMTQNNGYGNVTTKNVAFGTPKDNGEGICALPNYDGNGYWVLTYRTNSNQFLAYLFDTSGYTGTMVTSTSTTTNGQYFGTMNVSPDFTKIVALVGTPTQNSEMKLFTFNAQTGQLSEDWVISPYSQAGTYGFSADFSPNGDYIYYSGVFGSPKVVRYKLAGNTSGAAVKASEQIVGTMGVNGGSVKRGPDGKVYIANYGITSLATVTNPDAAGTGFTFNVAGQTLAGKVASFGLPQTVIGCSQPLPDLDGDGIQDLADLDDDNDGILDDNEDDCFIYKQDFQGSDALVYDAAANWLPGICQNGVLQATGGINNSKFLFHGTAGCAYGVGDEVWGTTTPIAVTQNHDHMISFQFYDANNVSDPQIVVYANGVNIGGPVTPTITGGWVKVSFPWNSGGNATLDLSFRNNNTAGTGNDFGFDDIKVMDVTVGCDADGDGISNSRDLDADNDGIPDNIEAQATATYIVPSGNDVDRDGLDDAYDNVSNAGLIAVNTDGSNDNPDYLDTDDNDDGTTDAIQAGVTLTGVDADHDGIDDGVDVNDAVFGPVNPAPNGTSTVAAGSNGMFAAYPDNGNQVTFRALPAPGCSDALLAVWLKANADVYSDAGITKITSTTGAVQQWNDQTSNANNVLQTVAASKPTYNGGSTASAINFNPVLSFNGTSSVLATTAGVMNENEVVKLPGDTSASFYVIFRKKAGNSPIFTYSNGSGGAWDIGANLAGSTVITNRAINAGTPLTNVPTLLSFDGNGVTGTARMNGIGVSAMTSVKALSGSQRLWVGAQGTNLFANADIAELISYNSSKTSDVQKIETYLGIKYGITLGHNYVSGSTGNTVYDVSTFGNNIAGIAREGCMDLHQKQSRSELSNIITMGIDNMIDTSNATNPAAIDINSAYLVWGDNNLSGTTLLPATSPGGCAPPPGTTHRTSRKWKVTETSTVESVKISADLTGQGFVMTYPVYMLVSADSTFNSYTSVPATVTGNTATVNYNFNSNATTYIAYAGNPTAPATICSGDKQITWWGNWNWGVKNKTITKGDQTFTFSVADPNNVMYYSPAYPVSYGNSVYIPRYDDQPNSKITFKMAMSKAAAGVSFPVYDIDGWAWGKDVVKVIGKLGATTVQPKLSQSAWSWLTLNQTNKTGTGGYWVTDYHPLGTMYVNFDSPIDSVIVEYTKENLFPTWKVFNDIAIGNFDITCKVPVPETPNPDNVYLFKQAQPDTAYTNEGFVYKFMIQNTNCDNKTIRFSDYLPSTLTWVDSSLATTMNLTGATVSNYGGTDGITIQNLLVPPGISYLYLTAKGTTSGTYQNQAEMSVLGGGTYFSDDPRIAGDENSTPVVILNNLPAANLAITKAVDSTHIAQLGTIKYTYTVTNNGSSSVKTYFEDALQGAAKYVGGTLTPVAPTVSLGSVIVNAYDTTGAITIRDLTIAANSSVNFSVNVNVGQTPVDSTLYNYAQVTPDMTSGYQQITVKSNTVGTLIGIPFATFTFNCGSATSTGTFIASGSGGQTGTLVIPMTSATLGMATYTVTGAGFSGSLSTILTAGQTSVTIPITYDGTGVAGTRTLTVTSAQGTGTCTNDVTVINLSASFAFNCGTVSSTGTFTATGSGGQTGTLTIPMTGATAGSATFNVTGSGFTGTLNTVLTAGQTSVSVPITYDGTGVAGTRILTITSTEGSGTCTVDVTVAQQIATFAFNCGTASSTGTFTASGVSGQTGTVTIPMTGATAGAATFNVTGSGFTGTLSTTLTTGQASVSVPITYDGTGVAGTRTLTITSSEGTGTCTVDVTVAQLMASFAFDCGTASTSGTFTATGVGGQTGSVTIPMTGATAGAATFNVSGSGFTGTLSTTLTAGQTSVSVPVTYDGTGVAGTRTLTITSTEGIGTCTTTATVNQQIATFAFDCGTASTSGTFIANGVGGQTGTVTVPMTGATPGAATFNISGSGFTGTLSTTLTAGQTSVSVPVTYDGSGAPGTRTLTITSTEGTGSCTATATVAQQVATFAFDCGTASATGTFVADNNAGQTGTVTIPMTGATAGSATFTVSGSGFTGTLSTILTAGQTSVTVPITFDGTGTPGTRTLTITSTEGSGTCTTSVTVATSTVDTDGDGVTDVTEIADGTSPTDGCAYNAAHVTQTQSSTWNALDCDGDGVINGTEVTDGTNPQNGCVYNAAHVTVAQSTAWNAGDCDSDGVTNGAEITVGTNPQSADTDGDGVADGTEIADGTSATNGCAYDPAHVTLTQSATWNAADCDGDGITNGAEITAGTNPLNSDTDGDGVTDGTEVADGTSATNGCAYNPAHITVAHSASWNALDCDSDGINNGDEVIAGTNPLSGDTDGDGVADGTEVADGTSATNACSFNPAHITLPVTATCSTDTDGDGVVDSQELNDGTSPTDGCAYNAAHVTQTQSSTWNALDCDGDGVINGTEVTDGTNPQNGCVYNAAHVTVAQSTAWNAGDCDSDGVTNGAEITGGTNPQSADTDGDGVADGTEIADGTSATNGCAYDPAHVTLTQSASWNAADCDGDGITNGAEVTAGTNPQNADTDGDGVTDGTEVADGTSATNGCAYNPAHITVAHSASWNALDCDSDGINNGDEVIAGTNPLSGDTDGDGVADGTEVADGTSATNACSFNPAHITLPVTATCSTDTDGDGVVDSQELNDGTSPTDGCAYNAAHVTQTQSSTWNALDCDGDGVINGTEVTDGTNPQNGCVYNAAHVTVAQSTAWNAGDCDSDGVTNGAEITGGTNPQSADTDGDGVADGTEIADGTSATNGCAYDPAHVTLTRSATWNAADCDGDGITNGAEITAGTNPLNSDTDGDGVTDGTEVADGTSATNGCAYNPAHITVAHSASWNALDCDSDGINNGDEVIAGTNPLSGDTDGDGVADGTEVADGTSATNACSFNPAHITLPVTATCSTDTDGDGVVDSQELNDGTSPTDGCAYNAAHITQAHSSTWNALDCDGDGVINGTEVTDGTNPQNGCVYNAAHVTVAQSTAWNAGDCDSDGVTNGAEITGGTNPQSADTDGDGVADGTEIADGTSATNGCAYDPAHVTLTQSASWNAADCDGDGITNGAEVTAGTNPQNADTDGDGVTDGTEVADGTSATNGCAYNPAHITVAHSASWNALDCDSDGVTNGAEVTAGTNPLLADTDGDGIPDATDLCPTVAGVAPTGCPSANGAMPDMAVTDMGAATSGNLSTNDVVPAGTTYGTPISVASNPSACAPVVASNGTYTFSCTTPGEYNFYIPVCPPSPATCTNVPLSITVVNPTASNGAPIANPDNASTLQGNAITVFVKANDACSNGPTCTLSNPAIVTGPGVVGATAVVNPNGSITYTPASGFFGKDSVRYSVCDNQTPVSKCDSEWIYIAVLQPTAPNSTSANDDFIQTAHGVTVTGNVSTNDSDPQGNTQTVTAQTTSIPGKGILVLASNGSYSFVPNANFVGGSVDFPYTVCDNGSPVACATATLHILVGHALPDLTPNITITPNILHGVTNFNVTVKITELNMVNTVGTITVRIPKDNRVSFTFNTAATSIGFTPVNNSTWTYDGSNPFFYIFTRNASINAGSFSTFGFVASFNPGNTDGKYSMTSTLSSGSGGDNKSINNSDSESADYFHN